MLTTLETYSSDRTRTESTPSGSNVSTKQSTSSGSMARTAPRDMVPM